MLGNMASQAGAGGSEFSDRLSTGAPRRVQASMLENPTMTIPAGTAIPCGTVTELDTTVPGQVSCQVSRSVYGADNKVRLIDTGANVTGLVEGGLSRGQARVFVAWQRARNPDHVTIQLDSAGAGALGAAGVGGRLITISGSVLETLWQFLFLETQALLHFLTYPAAHRATRRSTWILRRVLSIS